jgi:pentatricopeptide repeat protein
MVCESSHAVATALLMSCELSVVVPGAVVCKLYSLRCCMDRVRRSCTGATVPVQDIKCTAWHAGWLALTKGLFRKNNVMVAFQHLQKGLQEGWNPDASLFEHVIKAFCVADNMEQAQRVLASMPDLGCPPSTVHINLLVELVARLEGVGLSSPGVDIRSEAKYVALISLCLACATELIDFCIMVFHLSLGMQVLMQLWSTLSNHSMNKSRDHRWK